jgi:hypothetical protein
MLARQNSFNSFDGDINSDLQMTHHHSAILDDLNADETKEIKILDAVQALLYHQRFLPLLQQYQRNENKVSQCI